MKETQYYKTYYSISNLGEGVANWKSLKEIEEWGIENRFKILKADGKLFLINDKEIIIYCNSKMKRGV